MKANFYFRIVLLCLFPNLLSAAAIIYVNPAASGSNDGSSWDNAYTSLSTALASAMNGDEIWVKKGVYKPSTLFDANGNGVTEPQEATFKIPSGVALYGGFAGTEVNRNDRNFLTNITILSGDIDNNDLNPDGNSIAENTGQINGNNAYHVIYTSNVSAATRLDGFVVTAGRAMSPAVITDANQDGGGWYNQLSGAINASSPTIVNSTFQGNYAASEGGAFFCNSAPTGGAVISLIENCRFIANKSNVAGGAINIGSFNAGNYQPKIRRSEFRENEAFRRGGAIYLVGDHAVLDSVCFRSNKVTAVSPDNSTLPGSGGGVGMVASNASFTNCYFFGNTTTGNPTGAYEGGGGGAVYMTTNRSQTEILGISAPKFVNCGFYANSASGNVTAWGGAAVHLSDAGKLTPSYVGCVFSGNQAMDQGGAIANFVRVMGLEENGSYIPELTPQITNCTFTGNHAGKNGGAIYNQGFILNSVEFLHTYVENSILWGNTAGVSGAQISSTGIIDIAYSLVQSSGGSGAWNGTAGTNKGGNIDIDPGFVNAADPDGADNVAGTSDDGLRLNAAAAPVDKGNNSADGLTGVTTDFAGAARQQGPNVDMGAYERAGMVSSYPVKYWLKDWRPSRPVCSSCPWAFIFNEKILQKFVWERKAQLVDNGKTAVITGRIVHRDNKDIGFEVYLKLIYKHDWKSWSAKGRTYTALSQASIQAAAKFHQDWLFWELSNESYLKGTGDLSGKLFIAHSPTNRSIGFQLGVGANGWDADFGMSGSFKYKGTLMYRRAKFSVNGIAYMNVDAGKHKNDESRLAEFAETEESTKASSNIQSMMVYPNPVRDQLNIQTWEASRFDVQLIRTDGTTAKQMNTSATNGIISFSVQGLTPGSYILQLTGQDARTETQKIVIVE
ncbi:T9SS type A sorting domain-containing protein [Dyadobacter flavalbus]|uniref:T9SS type A sorting domain-containing protein n=1 Tax=Dyadobacter flavalbus TaxID=2579942 RepID=A0A5M8QRU1_9BACT|nr:T9SS type A sorting domain-containing protein [Dyadobacter flavalbus]KAA6438977.1 T9SS type A sorting domain-containing protein [Dyadobacter flavalbus]